MPVRKLHLMNAARRDATVDFASLKSPAGPRLGLPGEAIAFRRYVAAGEDGLHEALAARFGEDYAEALVEGDPEVDLEQVGRRVESTEQVYLSADGEVLHAPPEVVELIFGPDGALRETRDPEDVEANVNDELPVRWTNRLMPRRELVRRFVCERTLQVRHVDGLTYDYLYAMAKELDGKDAVVLMTGGTSGKEPLVFQQNGTRFRAFLEGRVDGERYMLLMHLSNLELKRPAAGEEEA